MFLGVGEHFCQVKWGCWGVADGNNRAGSELGGRKEVVVREWRVLGCSEWTDVDDRALKCSFGTLFDHFVGSVG